MTSRPTGLGRGLGALIPGGGPEIRSVDIDLVVPNPHQPRMVMRPEELAELSESIKEHGVLQPLLVSEVYGDTGTRTYQLIAGERRLQAARLAGLERIPVIVRETTEQEQLELALIENIQRADLGPLEEATAFRRLMTDFGLTQEDVARRVGKSRAAVANTLRLLGLGEEMKASLARGEMTEGHARALLAIPDEADRQAAWRQVVAGSLSVRQAEALAKKRPVTRVKSHVRLGGDPDIRRVEDQLRKALGTKVEIRGAGSSGTITIHYYSAEEYEAAVNYLLGT